VYRVRRASGCLFAAAALAACLSAQQNSPLAPLATKNKLEPEPIPLFPAVQAWIVSFGVPISAGGAMDAERIYVPLQTGEVKALERETGVELWQHELDTVWPPVVADGLVYVAGKGRLRALDARTGEPREEWPLEGAPAAPFIVHDGWIVTPLETGRIQARRVRIDGLPDVWSADLTSRARHKMVAGSESFFVVLEDGRVVALDRSGRMVWQQTLPGTLSEPAVAEDRVFVGSTNNFFYALDADTGDLEWKWRSGGDVIGAVADEMGSVYFASLDNILRAVNRGNGNQRWKTVMTTRPAIPPRAFGGVVVTTGVTPETTTFNAETGQPLGSYVAPAELQGAPLIDPVLKPYRVAMVVVTRDGRVIGLRPQAMIYAEPQLTPLHTLPGTRLPRESLSSSVP
jgi:outer membrane protein assembly factor BamB